MKEFLEGIWNAPKEDVANVVGVGLGIYAVWTLIVVALAVFVFYKQKDHFGRF